MPAMRSASTAALRPETIRDRLIAQRRRLGRLTDSAHCRRPPALPAHAAGDHPAGHGRGGFRVRRHLGFRRPERLPSGSRGCGSGLGCGRGKRLSRSTCFPLIWMDRALSKYAGVEEAGRWIDDGLELARECKAVEGAWVGLWHPNTTEALGFPGAEPAFVSSAPVAGRRSALFRLGPGIVRVAPVSALGSSRQRFGRWPGGAQDRAGQRAIIGIEDEAGDTIQVQVKSEQSVAPRRVWRALQVLAGVLLVGLAIRSVAAQLAEPAGPANRVAVLHRLAGRQRAVVFASLRGPHRGLAPGGARHGRTLAFTTAARIWFLASLGKYVPGKVWAIAGAAVLAQRAGVDPSVAVAGALVLQALALASGAAVVAATAGEAFRLVGQGALPIAAVVILLSLFGVGALTSQPLLDRLGRWLPGFLAPATSCSAGDGRGGVCRQRVGLDWLRVALRLLARGLLPGVLLSLPQAIGVFTCSYLAGFIALFAPGGLGPRESVFLLMLAGDIGLKPAAALALASRLLLTGHRGSSRRSPSVSAPRAEPPDRSRGLSDPIAVLRAGPDSSLGSLRGAWRCSPCSLFRQYLMSGSGRCSWGRTPWPPASCSGSSSWSTSGRWAGCLSGIPISSAACRP